MIESQFEINFKKMLLTQMNLLNSNLGQLIKQIEILNKELSWRNHK